MLAITALVLFVGGCSGLYVDTSYPYGPGPLDVASVTYLPSQIEENTPPMTSKVYYPTTPDLYATFYFITGMGGFAPNFIYDQLMILIASHGYVVIDTWALMGDDGPALLPKHHLENVDWMEENAWKDMNGTVGSFSDMGVGCHSAGCEFHMHMALNRTEEIKAMINLEPVGESINRIQPEHYLPAFSLGAEIANNSCSVPGFDFETWHSQLDCPKVMVENADVGHCDFLDFEYYLACNRTEQCDTGEPSVVEPYRTLVAGYAASWLGSYVQGNMDLLQYVTDPELIPWVLVQHDVDVDCEKY